jgi:hypothetical protein
MAITKCLIWLPPVNRFTPRRDVLRHCGRTATDIRRCLKWRPIMSKTNDTSSLPMTGNAINAKSEPLELHELSSEALDAVSGGTFRALETFGKALQKAGQI